MHYDSFPIFGLVFLDLITLILGFIAASISINTTFALTEWIVASLSTVLFGCSLFYPDEGNSLSTIRFQHFNCYPLGAYSHVSERSLLMQLSCLISEKHPFPVQHARFSDLDRRLIDSRIYLLYVLHLRTIGAIALFVVAILGVVGDDAGTPAFSLFIVNVSFATLGLLCPPVAFWQRTVVNFVCE